MAGGRPVGTAVRPTTVTPKTTGVGATARPSVVQAGPGGKPIVVRTVPKTGASGSAIRDRAAGASIHQAEDIFVGGEFQPTGDALVDIQLQILEAQKLAAEREAVRPSFFQPAYSMTSVDGRGGEYSGAPVFTGTTGLEMSGEVDALEDDVVSGDRESTRSYPEIVDEHFGRRPPLALFVNAELVIGVRAEVAWGGAVRTYSEGSPYTRWSVRMVDIETGDPVDLPIELQMLHKER